MFFTHASILLGKGMKAITQFEVSQLLTVSIMDSVVGDLPISRNGLEFDSWSRYEWVYANHERQQRYIDIQFLYQHRNYFTDISSIRTHTGCGRENIVFLLIIVGFIITRFFAAPFINPQLWVLWKEIALSYRLLVISNMFLHGL